ncbi:MAG: hypothetical protein HZY79_04640 [Rhodoblastus sp.]|nr:MAG: hypothetical protein HZY79_04640 [Rhodoblastus sp.]
MFVNPGKRLRAISAGAPRRFGALGVATAVTLATFGLAACTQPTPISPKAQAALQAAGFRPASPESGLAGGFVMDAAYVCPAQRCGDVVIVGMGTMDVVSALRAKGFSWPQGVTFEQMARMLPNGRRIVELALKEGFKRTARTEGVKLGPIAVDRSGTTARVQLTLNEKGQVFHVSAVLTFQGDNGRILGSLSPSRAVASRYARAEWLR